MLMHQGFLTRLISLVEYAERHGMTEAAAALSAATEVIAPLLHYPAIAALETADSSNVICMTAYQTARA